MTPKQREEHVRRYFERPKPVGVLLAFFWLVIPLLVAIGRMLLNSLRRSQFRDEDIDRMINTAMERGQELAHQRVFGPQAKRADVVNVVTLYVPYVERHSPTPAVPKEDMVARRGQDRMLRFGAYRFVFMYPTLNYLAVFTTQYNLITDTLDDQGHEIEYPYRHIVSIESGPEHGQFRERGARHERSLVVGQWFKIVNTGGERFTVGVRYADLDAVLPGERFATIALKGGQIEGLEALEARLTDARKRIRDILRQREGATAGASTQTWGPPAGDSSPDV